MRRNKRTFPTAQFGEALIQEGKYANGGLAVQLYCEMEGVPGAMEPLAKLSIWLDRSNELPPGCFFVKTYSENGLIIDDVAKSGWFTPRLDLSLQFGDEVWELLNEKSEGFVYAG